MAILDDIVEIILVGFFVVVSIIPILWLSMLVIILCGESVLIGSSGSIEDIVHVCLGLKLLVLGVVVVGFTTS